MSNKDVLNKAKEKTKELIESGEIKYAKELIEKYEDLLKDDVEVYSMKAIIAMVEGRIEEAEQILLEGYKVNKYSIDILYNLGFLYENKEKYNEALKFYKKAKLYCTTVEEDNELKDKLSNLMKYCCLDEKTKESKIIDIQKKIVFFVKQGMDSFLVDIIDSLSSDYNVKQIIIKNNEDLKLIDTWMEWADICWFEWCDELVVYGSKLPIAKERRIICRLHSYEAFTYYPGQVNWESIDKLIFVSDHIRNIVLDKINIDVSKTEIIYNGINTNEYKYIERKRGFNIAYVGYINYKKGPMLLLHTFKAIYDRDNRYKLHIAGSFQDERYALYFIEKIKDFGLEKNVIYYGWQDNISEWLQDKNYIICTSILEGNPVGLMEAMSLGIKPIIHSFVGAKELYPKEFIWNTIEEAVQMILGNDYDSKKYRDYVESNFTMELQVKKIKRMFNDMLKEKMILSKSKIKGISTEFIYDYISNKKFSAGLKVYVENNNTEVIDRISYLEKICKDKKVIHLGCADHLDLIDSKRHNKLWLHDILTSASKVCIGFDINKRAVDYINNNLGISNVFCEDIAKERSSKILNEKWDIMVIGEILEHVNTPVEFLKTIKCFYKGALERLVITVPNALRLENHLFSKEGYECINSDHKYWFTPYTICKIVNESGLEIEEVFMTTGYKVKNSDIKEMLRKTNILMDTIAITSKL